MPCRSIANHNRLAACVESTPVSLGTTEAWERTTLGRRFRRDDDWGASSGRPQPSSFPRNRNFAVQTAQALVEVFRADSARIRELKRAASSALRVHQRLQERPLGSIASLSKATELTVPTVTGALESLIGLGIVRETTGRQRNRVLAYGRYIDLLTREVK